jgi:hypothetical protein
MPGRFRRSFGRLRRWSLRAVLLAAVVNLAWDLWAWQDRTFASGDRRYFRHAEWPDEIDYGFAELRIANETGREYMIEAAGFDGPAWPPYGASAQEQRLAPAGTPGAERITEQYLFRLVSNGDLRLREEPDGPVRVIRFTVDRRGPISSRVELRIRDDGQTVSGCLPLPRMGPSFPWLAGPADY